MKRDLTPEVRRQFSENMRQRNADPLFRANHAMAMRNGNAARKGHQTKPRPFAVPPKHSKVYRKLRHAIGVEAARAELKRLIAQDALNASPQGHSQ